jgi:hypothetical protein
MLAGRAADDADKFKSPAHLSALFAFASFVEYLDASKQRLCACVCAMSRHAKMRIHSVDEMHATVDELAQGLLQRCRDTAYVRTRCVVHNCDRVSLVRRPDS